VTSGASVAELTPSSRHTAPDGALTEVIVIADTSGVNAAWVPRSGELTAGRRFVLAHNQAHPRQEAGDSAKVTFVDSNPIRRQSLLRAVGVAAGRRSPEVRTEVQRSTAARVEVPSTEDALALGQLVLVAENNLTNQDVIRRQLHLLGYQSEMANDGREALQMWGEKAYGILLTDCHMPHFDGFELAGQVRLSETGSGRRAPIVAITANALEGEAHRCFAAGMDEYLTKPLLMSSLKATLEKWLGPSRGARATSRKQSETPSGKTDSGCLRNAGKQRLTRALFAMCLAMTTRQFARF
jgi:CheY-like chemotaxis protein